MDDSEAVRLGNTECPADDGSVGCDSVEGDGDPLLISDYRPLGVGSELLAHEVVAESTFVRIRLRLATSGPTPTPAVKP